MRLSFLRSSAGSLSTGLSAGAPRPLSRPALLCTARVYYYLLQHIALTREKRTCKHGLPVGAGLVVGDATSRTDGCSSISEARVFSVHKPG